MTEFKLGDRVKFTHVVQKQRIVKYFDSKSAEVDVVNLFPQNYSYSKMHTLYSEVNLNPDSYYFGNALELPYRDIWSLNREYSGEPESSMWLSRREVFNTGMITGKRYVSDYKIDQGSYDEPTTAIMIAGTTRPVYLVTYNLHKNPVMVFPHHLERITDDS